jgi:hypothetical protein
MDLAFTAEELAFRAEVRTWVEQNLPPNWPTRCTTASA